MEKQTTLKSPVTLSGRGLHTGQDVQVTLCPAFANQGYLFRRVDLNPPVDIPARADNVGDIARGTTLVVGGVRVATVEHLLSALHGMEVDNVVIEVSGEEIPILDGSARPWVEAIQEVGIATLNSVRRYYYVRETVSMTDPDNPNIEYLAVPCDTFRVTTVIDFKSSVIGKQYAEMQGYGSYTADVAPCRTFVFLHEIEPLLNNNLIKGGDLDNALVFVDHPLEPDQAKRLAKVYGKTAASLKVSNGVLNTIEPYFPNEPARHKMLDFMGDITLTGVRLRGHFIIKCPGHKSNVAFAMLMSRLVNGDARPDQVPIYDPNCPPVFDNAAIRNILPQRYPLLFVDKIVEVGPDYVVAVKNITIDEPFFVGHFPDSPVLPGVLQIEAMAQAGGVLATRNYENPRDYRVVLARVDGVKFRQQVLPGDTLVLKVKITAPLRRGLLKMRGEAYVGHNLVTEATMVAQIIKREESE